MLLVLAFRHLRVKKVRSLLLLVGYGFGVGVMIVLLSVGTALLEQSRDVSLVGGGEVTVLPEGIDVEAMRTGGLSGMFFSIERARYLTRLVLGGPRHASLVRAVSPLIEHKLVYVEFRGETVAARAGGEVPSRARAAGAPLEVLAGRWEDSPADSAYVAPSPQQLYDQLDRFHLPPRADSSWAEWQYFNVLAGPSEWWYLTYLVAGDLRGGRWGGRLLVTRRTPGGHQRFWAAIPAQAIRFDTAGADLTLGENAVRQRDGRYALRGVARGPGGRVELDLMVEPEPYRYFPPVALSEGAIPSGYVVPVLAGRARGRLCVNGSCRSVRDAPAYHDHNWGIWRGVRWDWGTARGGQLDLLYGVVHLPGDTVLGPGVRRSLFVPLVASLGVLQVFRARQVDYRGPGERPLRAGEVPVGFRITATREADTLQVNTAVTDAAATRETAAGPGWMFLQMRGRARLEGRLSGAPVADSGWGFFETYVPTPGLRGFTE